MNRLLKQMKVWNIIMVAVVAYLFVIGGMIVANGALPFGMDEEPRMTASILMPWFFVLAVVTLVQTVFGFLSVRDPKKGAACNIVGWITWIVGLLLFIIGIGASGYEWISFFIITLPPIFQAAAARALVGMRV